MYVCVLRVERRSVKEKRRKKIHRLQTIILLHATNLYYYYDYCDNTALQAWQVSAVQFGAAKYNVLHP